MHAESEGVVVTRHYVSKKTIPDNHAHAAFSFTCYLLVAATKCPIIENIQDWKDAHNGMLMLKSNTREFLHGEASKNRIHINTNTIDIP